LGEPSLGPAGSHGALEPWPVKGLGLELNFRNVVRGAPFTPSHAKDGDREGARFLPDRPTHSQSQGGVPMKRMSVMCAVLALVAVMLSGCVIVPAGGWHGSGWSGHHRHYGPPPYRR
jgi:hypothetical protein